MLGTTQLPDKVQQGLHTHPWTRKSGNKKHDFLKINQILHCWRRLGQLLGFCLHVREAAVNAPDPAVGRERLQAATALARAAQAALRALVCTRCWSL